ncbi:MAG: enoyl-CoA hydratase-related protein [Thermodesulfobacteriota bacterium]|nr:enoyl-CoA hydratase-related protein [Thermodesulfobacteriota bacterium]
MDFKLIELRRMGKIEIVRLMHPSINQEMVKELETYFLSVREDDEVGAVILNGSGNGFFSEGFHSSQRSSFSPISAERFSRDGQSFLLLIENLGKAVIAGVDGRASAEGFELVLACPLRIASEDAIFNLPQVGLGLIPGWGGIHRLARIIGMSKALELILTGRDLAVLEAQEIGLINRLVSREDLEKECLEMAETILTKGPVAVRLALEAIHRGIESSLEIGSALESSFMGLCYATEDKDEGLKAFFEKRSPNFKGE